MGQRPDEVESRLDLDTTGATDTGEADPAEIRAEIEQTRAGMSQTIEELTERLSPSHLKEQVKEQVMEQVQEVKETVREATIGRAEDMVRYAGETVSDAQAGLFETIRQNPIPAALTGIGLGWLWMNRRSGQSQQRRGARFYQGDNRSRTYGGDDRYYETRYYDDRRAYEQPRYYEARGYQGQGSGGTMSQARDAAGNMASQARDTAGNVVSQARDTAGNVVSQARDTAGNVVGQAQETVSNIADTAQNTAGQVVDTVQQTASDVYGRATYQAQRLEDRFQQQLTENPLVVGALSLALGAAVGLAVPTTQKEDQLMGQARDTLIDRATEMASQTMDKVQQVAGQVADQTMDKVQEVAGEAKDTAKQAAQQQGLTSS